LHLSRAGKKIVQTRLSIIYKGNRMISRSFDTRLDNILYIRPGGVDKRTEGNNTALLRNPNDSPWAFSKNKLNKCIDI